MLRTAARQLLSAASAQHPQLDCTRAAAAAARCLHACCRSGSSAATCADGVEHSLHVSDLKLQHGGTFHTATVVYKTFGNPNNPAILFPTSFDATHSDGEYAIGPGRILDSSRYFVVVPVRSPSARRPRPRRGGPRLSVVESGLVRLRAAPLIGCVVLWERSC